MFIDQILSCSSYSKKTHIKKHYDKILTSAFSIKVLSQFLLVYFT